VASSTAGWPLKTLSPILTEFPLSDKYVTNSQFANTDQAFKTACKAVNTPATSRQASKWRNKFGLAFTKGRAS